MRVISGTAKGRKLYTPKSHNIRPAIDKVKGAIFNILFNVEGLTILDLFAGTGAIGIEALSRGAKHATFVDSSSEGITIIKKNIELCKFSDRSRVFPKTVNIATDYFAKHGEKFDIIFVDPPYLKNLVNPTLEKILSSGVLSDGGLIVVEHSPKEPISSAFLPAPRLPALSIVEGPGGEPANPRTCKLTLTDTRKYGQTCVSFLKVLTHNHFNRVG